MQWFAPFTQSVNSLFPDTVPNLRLSLGKPTSHDQVVHVPPNKPLKLSGRTNLSYVRSAPLGSVADRQHPRDSVRERVVA